MAQAATAIRAAKRAFLASTAGLSCYGTYKAKCDPPHLVWDLDNTILCSLCPIPTNDNDSDNNEEEQSEYKYPNDKTRYFDQIDDDFPYDNDTPNTRTYWRPGARTALEICGYFATQHVYTTAQGTYTANVLSELDPKGEIFDTIIHRDKVPASVKKGKDLSLITDRLDRAIIFDDRTKNFVPQEGRNGVQVKLFDDASVRGSDFEEMKEVARLVGISVLGLLARDVRDVVRYFRSEEHRKRFLDTTENCSSSVSSAK